ncbi:MAG: hypothetical protein ACK55Z_22705 [bacterium]
MSGTAYSPSSLPADTRSELSDDFADSSAPTAAVRARMLLLLLLIFNK